MKLTKIIYKISIKLSNLYYFEKQKKPIFLFPEFIFVYVKREIMFEYKISLKTGSINYYVVHVLKQKYDEEFTIVL